MNRITATEIEDMRNTVNKTEQGNFKSSFELALNSFESFIQEKKIVDGQKLEAEDILCPKNKQ